MQNTWTPEKHCRCVACSQQPHKKPRGKDLRVEFDEPKAGDPVWPYFGPIWRYAKDSLASI